MVFLGDNMLYIIGLKENVPVRGNFHFRRKKAPVLGDGKGVSEEMALISPGI